MPAFIDARTVPAGTTIETDILLIGGGPAGITLAIALADTKARVTLLESGGMEFDAATQALYDGPETGVHYLTLDGSRLRFLGGSTNHWGGWCRPLDRIDFEKRSWLAHSGWPFGREALEPYYPRAQSLVEAGPPIYDRPDVWSRGAGDKPLTLGDGGVYTTFFQFSKMRGSTLPTHFGERYAEDLKRIENLNLYLNANVTALKLAKHARQLDHVQVATLGGTAFTVRPRITVLCMGAIENARLMLASNDVMKPGVGNGNDLVGRYFADHPIPGETATMALFDGRLAPYYLNNSDANGVHFRAAFAPSDVFKREAHVLGSLITVDGTRKLGDIGLAVVKAAADALRIDASKARVFNLGCGLEPEPDPERRITLANTRDALGMPQAKLTMRIADADFDRYRRTLSELGRQLMAAGIGVLQIRHKRREDWLAGLDWANHHMGTTRMHVDPKQGVVDADSKVHGIANLFVGGSGVFPTYGASNPTMNLVALSLRLADHLKGALR